MPFCDINNVSEDAAGAVPAYETTAACDEKGESKPRQVSSLLLRLMLKKLIIRVKNDMSELQAEEHVFLDCLLSRYDTPTLLTGCTCGVENRLQKVLCGDCLQGELLCPQCWVNKHRTMPTHWAFVWNKDERFFEKKDFCRVLKNTVVALGHHGQRCPDADLGRSFTLVESNGIHATAISFCRCKRPDGQRGDPEFQQLLRAGIFPGSIKEPKTGYTLGLLEFYHQLRNQGKTSAYNFTHVLQRMADPFFADSVPVS
jgi:hypothetical protein